MKILESADRSMEQGGKSIKKKFMKNHISSSAIIGRVKLGKNIYIGNNSVIGTQPQYVGFNKNKILSAKFKNLIIADNVVIMDLCHIHAGIKRNTKIGKDTMIMSGTHIGHDVQILKGCNVSPNVAFAGEVTLKNNVTIGMGFHDTPRNYYWIVCNDWNGRCCNRKYSTIYYIRRSPCKKN